MARPGPPPAMLLIRPATTGPVLGVLLLIPWVILLLLVVRRGPAIGLGRGCPSPLLLVVTALLLSVHCRIIYGLLLLIVLISCH